MPSMTNVGVASTTTCPVCATVTPSPVSLSARAHAAAHGVTVTPSPQGPGPSFKQAEGPRQSLSPSPATPASQQGSHPKLNIPMIAGLATAGAVVAGGGIATAAVLMNNKKKEKKHEESLVEGEAKARASEAASSTPLASTVLVAAVNKGDTVLEVASVAGFAIGDTIQIGDEFNAVKGFSSIILDHPMNSNQQSGLEVKVIHQPPNAIVQGASLVMASPAPTFLAATPAPAAGSSQNGSSMTVFYCILAGILLCGFFFCIVAFVGIFMKRKKGGSKDVYAGVQVENGEEESEEEEQEEEDEVSEEDS